MLARLQSLESPIRKLQIVGVGAMGRGLVQQCALTPGIECIGVADVNVDGALEHLSDLGHSCREVASREEARRALMSGKLPVFGSALELCELPEMDVVVEASSAVADGGRRRVRALQHGKHLVLMNAEIDLIFGPALLQL